MAVYFLTKFQTVKLTEIKMGYMKSDNEQIMTEKGRWTIDFRTMEDSQLVSDDGRSTMEFKFIFTLKV